MVDRAANGAAELVLDEVIARNLGVALLLNQLLATSDGSRWYSFRLP